MEFRPARVQQAYSPNEVYAECHCLVVNQFPSGRLSQNPWIFTIEPHKTAKLGWVASLAKYEPRRFTLWRM